MDSYKSLDDSFDQQHQQISISIPSVFNLVQKHVIVNALIIKNISVGFREKNHRLAQQHNMNSFNNFVKSLY